MFLQHDFFHLFNNLRMLLRDIVFFANIFIKAVEFNRVSGSASTIGFPRPHAGSRWSSGRRLGLVVRWPVVWW